MPGGDGTGPMGMGPMTGRAAGFCAGTGAPGFANPLSGRGFGRGTGGGFGGGRGGGRGRRNMFYATGMTGWQRAGFGGGVMAPAMAMPTKEQEMAALKAQAESMGNALSGIRERIAEIEKENK